MASLSVTRMSKLATAGKPCVARLLKAPAAGTKAPFLQRRVPAFTNTRTFSASCAVEAKRYSKDHEWVELDSDGTTGTIGISTYAANALGDVVYVELPEVDAEVAQGDTIGAVESVKSASDLLSPVAGTILETNAELEKTPGNINKNPEGSSWIAKIKVKDTVELDSLMDEEAYAQFTSE